MGMRPPRVDDADVEIGRLIARLRREVRLRQLDLALHINVSVQLVRKYESGRIRIGSSRLAAIATALGVPIAALVDRDGCNYQRGAREELTELAAFLRTNEGTALNMAFQRIKSIQVRRSLLALVRVCSQSL